MLIKYTYIFIRLRMFEIEEYFELDFISIPPMTWEVIKFFMI